MRVGPATSLRPTVASQKRPQKDLEEKIGKKISTVLGLLDLCITDFIKNVSD